MPLIVINSLTQTVNKKGNKVNHLNLELSSNVKKKVMINNTELNLIKHENPDLHGEILSKSGGHFNERTD